MERERAAASIVSLSDVLSSMSYALDLTEGQPAGHAVRSCVIGMRLADAVGLASEERAALYWALLLKDVGSSVNAAMVSEFYGSDDHEVKRDLKTTNWTRRADRVVHALRNAARGRPFTERVRQVVSMANGGSNVARAMVRMRCERGADIVTALGFPDSTASSIRALDEHWDGSGHPNGLAGEAIPMAARIVALAQTVEVYLRQGGPRAALGVVRARRGSWFDPALADEAASWADDRSWWDAVRHASARTMVLDLEPSDRARTVDAEGLDRIAEAFAEIIDAKSPYTYQHSAKVAAYATGLARSLGLDAATQRTLYRAALLHDIGKLGVSSRILDKPGSLTAAERRAVERHPALTWQILLEVSAFESFAAIAATHHERLDGKGYPWRLSGPHLELPARVLAVADRYEALTADRPYRAALSRTAALAILRAASGRAVDGAVVDALRRNIGAVEAGAVDRSTRRFGTSAA